MSKDPVGRKRFELIYVAVVKTTGGFRMGGWWESPAGAPCGAVTDDVRVTTPREKRQGARHRKDCV